MYILRPSDYEQLLTQQSRHRADIDKDIPRTYMVRDMPTLQSSLRNVLLAFSNSHSDVGYCQGMNFIAGTLLIVLPDESSAFHCLEGIFTRLQLDSLFKPGVPDLLKRHFQFGYYLKQHFPDLSAHFKRIGVTSGVFVDKWCMGLFSSYLPMSTLLRVWDVLVYEGWKAMVKVGMAVLADLKPMLLTMDLEQLSIYLRDHTRDDHRDAESLLLIASHIKVTNAGLKRLDGEFLVEQAEEKVEHTDRYPDLTENEVSFIENARFELNRFQPLLKENIQNYQISVEFLEKEVDLLRSEKDKISTEIEEIENEIEKFSLQKSENIEKLRKIESKSANSHRNFIQMSAMTFECVSIQPENYSNPGNFPSEIDSLRSNLTTLDQQIQSLQLLHKSKVTIILVIPENNRRKCV